MFYLIIPINVHIFFEFGSFHFQKMNIHQIKNYTSFFVPLKSFISNIFKIKKMNLEGMKTKQSVKKEVSKLLAYQSKMSKID